MIIALDFDGTCVNHAYPEIGFEIGSVPVLKALQEKGFKFILFTMRSGDLLQNAVNWFEDNDIKFVDPRGPSIFGSVYYDLAKMYESYILGFGDIVSNYKHEYDLKIFEDFVNKYNKHLILTIVYINLISKLKLHNNEEQKRFIELAKRVYEWL